MTRPVALLTGIVPPYRREPFRLLGDAERVEVIAHRGREADAVRMVLSGRYRAVIAGLGGRVALPGAYLAARRRRIPFVLWTGVWTHPRTPFHALSWPATRHLYRHADAVVTYGPHVSRYVERHRRAGYVFEAPQSVEAELFGRTVAQDERRAVRERIGGDFVLLFVGRLEREKGVEVLLRAWRLAGVGRAVLAIAGAGPLSVSGAGVVALGQVERTRLPAVYAAADALVLPSIRTATFLEPWGLVVNEAMHQALPVIATDAVGAAAGGLVRDGRNGLVVGAGDAEALAARIRTLAANPALRQRLGTAARGDVAACSAAAWVGGMRAALRAVGAGR